MFNSNKLYFLADFDVIVGGTSPTDVNKAETKMMEKLRAPKKKIISFTVDLYEDSVEETWHRNFKFDGDETIYYRSFEDDEEYISFRKKLEFKYEIDFHNDSKYRIYLDGQIYEDEPNIAQSIKSEFDTLDEALEYCENIDCQYIIVCRNKIINLGLKCARCIPLPGDWDDLDNIRTEIVPYDF